MKTLLAITFAFVFISVVLIVSEAGWLVWLGVFCAIFANNLSLAIITKRANDRGPSQTRDTTTGNKP